MASSILRDKRNYGLPLAVVILTVAGFLPPLEGLSHEGIMGLAVLFAAVVLWMCETLPMGVTALLALVMVPILGVAPLNTVFSGYATSTTIFAIAVFSLTAAVMKSNLAIRLVGFAVKFAGNSPKKLVLAFMTAGWILSAVMNDSATLVLMLGLIDVVLLAAGAQKGKSNLAKCLYIGSAFGVFMGGMATPAGASTNVLALGLIQQATGQTVPFVDWIAVVAPVAAVMLPVIWFILVRVFKPEPISQEAIDALIEKSTVLGKMTVGEIKTLVMLVGIPTLWIIGSWVPALDVATVSVIGLAVMCAPGMRLLTFPEFQKEVPWNVVLMIGGVISLGSVLSATGGVAFLANLFLSTGVMGLGLLGTVWVVVFVCYVTHSFIPIGPGFAMLLIPPLMTSFMEMGYSPAIPAILIGCILAGNLLFPINPALALAYRDNVFTFFDPTKVGIVPVFVMTTLLALWVPFMVGVLGLPK